MIIKKIYIQKTCNSLTTEGINTFVNPYSYLLLRKTDNLNYIDNIFVDGILLVKLFRMIGINVSRKSFDMTSLAPKVFKECTERSKSVYFIGSKKSDVNEFTNIIKKEYPKLNVIGKRDGYFSNRDERSLEIDKLITINPDVLVCGMGTPFQEDFLIDLKKKGWKGAGYSCGGFIHQTVNRLEYYPNFYNKYNLRWLYRIMDEPKLFKRYAFVYPKAMIIFIFDAFKFLQYKNQVNGKN